MNDRMPTERHPLFNSLRVMEHWEDIVADMEAISSELKDGGWRTVELHPGDVSAIHPEEDPEQFGFDVLIPDNEFESLSALVNGEASFDAYDVYRAQQSGMVIVLVVMKDEENEVAVLYPAFYRIEEATPVLDASEKEGGLHVTFRTLSGDAHTFTYQKTDLFAPN